MEFGWINLFGAGIVVLIMIPNIIYAARQKQDETQIEVPHGLSACEQVGRYGCIILMWLPLLVWKFGFGSVEETEPCCCVIICPGCSTREKRPYQ